MDDLIDDRDVPPALPRWATVLVVAVTVLCLATAAGAWSEGRWTGVAAFVANAVLAVGAYLRARRRLAAEREAWLAARPRAAAGPDQACE